MDDLGLSGGFGEDRLKSLVTGDAGLLKFLKNSSNFEFDRSKNGLLKDRLSGEESGEKCSDEMTRDPGRGLLLSIRTKRVGEGV